MTKPTSNGEDESGKGKERDTEDVSPMPGLERATSQSPPLASRFRASATALSRTMINGHLESAILKTSSSGKQQQSSIHAIDSSATEDLSQPGPSNISSGSRSGRFGSTVPDPASEGRYSNFINSDTTSNSAMIITDVPSRYGPVDESNSLPSDASHWGPSALEVQESQDGIEAVQLLSSLETSCTVMPDSLESVTTFVLSPHESATLKSSLFGDDQFQGSHQNSRDWNELLNFQPDFLIAGNMDESYQHFGVRNSVQAEQMWLDDWRDVLSSYTDAVWGDLNPLAEAARNELNIAEEPSRDSRPTDMKALSRLRQILAHVRDSN